MSDQLDLQNRAINAVRFLSADAVQQAKSGHPGLPMGAAAMAYTIWTRHLKFNPKNPDWFDRDRFILSGGHGSMLLYSLLYLTGFDLSLDELKRFRQWGSKTPGHPEYGLTPGVETTTGPLGQGFANGVGMAIAEAHLAAEYNRPGHEIINHYVYGIVTDGDLMEGVASEAASIAGHLRLGKLIYLYDDNHVSIEGSTDLAFTEDRGKRFEAYDWHVQHVADGNDVEAIDKAILSAKKDPRPSIIMVRTQIGYGLPTRAGTSKAHGEPPGEEELKGAKENLGWPVETRFFVPEDVLAFYRKSVGCGQEWEEDHKKRLAAYRQAYPELSRTLEGRLAGKLPDGWEKGLPVFPPDAKGVPTRSASQKVLQVLGENIQALMGGSADLSPSTNTLLPNTGDFQPASPLGRNMHFGVREHGMGAVVNGMAYHKGLIPYGATFLVFSDYMRPAIRISAISELGSIWVFTHDSIGLGEDGPTHQPIEQLASLRTIPNLVVIRPGDANEVREAWIAAVQRRHAPTALLLTRQVVTVQDRSILAPAEGLQRGAYVLADLGGAKPEIIFMASGSEVQLIVEAGYRLAEEGVNVRLVSFPSWELFEQQDQIYRDKVLLPDVKFRLAVEAGVMQGWERYVGDRGKLIGMKGYGASAPYMILFEQFGFTSANVQATAKSMIGKK
jgi:transketolase